MQKNKRSCRSHNFVTPTEEQISKETLYLTIQNKVKRK